MKLNVEARFNERRYSDEAIIANSDRPRVNVVLKMIGSKCRVLDIGCYSGLIGSLIAANGNDVYGVDLSETSVNLAKQKGINAYHIDVSNVLPFVFNFFDVVFAGEVIEHVYGTDGFLQEIKSIKTKWTTCFDYIQLSFIWA